MGFEKALEGDDPIVVVAADPSWVDEFSRAGEELRRLLGSTALRIDHVGSTSVPKLDAKPVLDVQVSVASLEPERTYRHPLESAGYVYHASNSDRTQRFFREPPGVRRLHIHVRAAGSFDEQLNLLFRDFLRRHPQEALEYARVKHALADQFRLDRPGYVQAKEPTVWAILVRAHDWAQETGWSPGPSDA